MKMRTRTLTVTAIMLALATAHSYVTIFKLPMGGSITLFSQVPIIIIGYSYGAKWGISTGIIYGILQILLQVLKVQGKPHRPLSPHLQ